MILPPALRERLHERLGTPGAAVTVGGGCIHRAARVELPGEAAFLKWGAAPAGHFGVEARGLDRLREAGTPLRVPHVLGWDDVAGNVPAWLCLEWIPGVSEPGRDDADLGRALAALHAPRTGGWGWEEDGWIGPLPQANGTTPTWAEFWWTRRLEPQLRLAASRGADPAAPGEWHRLGKRLPALLAPAEHDGPSLLHGDLWSGNALRLPGGGAALVDLAAYRGHREVDLAMAELFGGFGPRFRPAYEAERPLLPGYDAGRRAVYQLYPLLVHLNLFGGGYGAQTSAALRVALRA